ncbi:histidine kinase [Undibacterium sp. JH2W]|uniref:histidine kinase n=1 Tax=Undibacterium sp. JH2W TaxID=3413037 RepID=UPI003BF1F857
MSKQALSIEQASFTLSPVPWWKSTAIIIMVWSIFAFIWASTSYVDGFAENTVNQRDWDFKLNFTVLAPYILLNSILAVFFNKYAEKLSRPHVLGLLLFTLILLFVPIAEFYQLIIFVQKGSNRWPDMQDIERSYRPEYFSQSAMHTSLAFFGQVFYTHWLLHHQRELAFEKAIQHNLSLKIRILQGKLEPYFLLSSLENIQKLIHNTAQAEANTALVRLSNLLRYVLENDANEAIPVADEMQFLRDYFNLQKLCLGQGFSVTWDKEERDWHSYTCPGLILLSLADSSICQMLKGYANDNQILELQFKCFVANRQFCASFSFPQTKVLPQDVNPGYIMVGQRLEILFGGKAQLSMQSNLQEQRQAISIHFPLQTISND